mmetsp:Transcript_43423/g.102556  ORF Transcript_43423/g.102556 Transcript_43423/m.102556 type:complete len:219 (-) Transcript_43423:31-687(-)
MRRRLRGGRGSSAGSARRRRRRPLRTWQRPTKSSGCTSVPTGAGPAVPSRRNSSRCMRSGKKFAVVFISSDKDQEKFDEYFGSMPWLALPSAERDLKAQLGHKACFNVRDIPTLVIIDVKTGKVLEADSWAAVEIEAESWALDEESIAAGKAKAEAKAKAAEEESCRKQEEASGANMVIRRKTGEVGGCAVDAEARVVSGAQRFLQRASSGPKGERAY